MLLQSMKVFSTGGPSKVFIRKILKPNDPRGYSKIFDTARAEETYGLLNRRVFEIVLEKDVPKTANVMGSRFVLVIKNFVANDEHFEARFVV